MSAERTVKVQGATISYLARGSGEPLLLLHGVRGLSWAPETWPAFAESLPETFSVIAPAHPEFGLSERPQDCETVDDLVYFYADFMEAIGVDRAHVVGHSFGAWIAADLALKQQTKVGHLVLANPLGIWIAQEPIPDIFMLSATDATQLAHADAGVAAASIPGDLDQSEQWFADWSAFARYAWTPSLHDPRLAARLHRIKAAALIVVGAQDRITSPAYGRQFAQLIPESQLRVLDGAGHALPLECPQEFARLLIEFLPTRPDAGAEPSSGDRDLARRSTS